MIRYATLCSGICAPTVAWKPMGWQPVYFSETAKFPSRALKYHYPGVPNLGDMNHIHNHPTFLNEPVDLICAGTPCQSFSLAGLRAGMASPNGNLALQFLRLLDIARPRWMVWENVPGVLSSWSDAETDKQGNIWQTNDFDTFLSGLRELGYGVAVSILDAQYFGIPQQRRRVFCVGYLGDWRRAAAVLFEQESLYRHHKALQKPRTSVAALTASGIGVGGADAAHAHAGHIIGTLNANGKGAGSVTGQDAQNGFLVISAEGSTGLPSKTVSNTSKGIHNQSPLVFQSNKSAAGSMNPGSISPTVGAMNGKAIGVMVPGKEISPTVSAVRRLTPLECERLQGLPDGYTRIPHNNKIYKQPKITKLLSSDRWEETENGWVLMAADGPRYQSIGNSMAVPVLAWLGNRIQMVDQLQNL